MILCAQRLISPAGWGIPPAVWLVGARWLVRWRSILQEGEYVTLYFKASFDFGRFSYSFILNRFEFSWYVNYYQIASRDRKRKKKNKWAKMTDAMFARVLCSLLPVSPGFFLNSMVYGIGGGYDSRNAAALLKRWKRKQNITHKARRSPTFLCN